MDRTGEFETRLNDLDALLTTFVTQILFHFIRRGQLTKDDAPKLIELAMRGVPVSEHGQNLAALIRARIQEERSVPL